MAEAELYYQHVPRAVRPVAVPVEFVSVTQFLADEAACQTLWELVSSQFRTRGKFLSVWPHVRHVALCRDDQGAVTGLLLVSTPLNWQIDYVVVRPDARRQGLAAALVNATLNHALAAGVPYVMLTSREGLRPLYEGECGFTVVGRKELAAVSDQQSARTGTPGG
jgi:GNAT superfamily N-acetyltransferase